ncbi:MAG: nucleotidyltransferase substrate binding protein [Anaerolineae bacterium]|nr:nucleotidyltransferase substrate binding protein [Anaerolineae bacterium]
MSEVQDIRWKQRFQNFERAFTLLEQALQIDAPSDVERAGMIQFFEMSFELAWKLLKDYLEEEGFTVTSPKTALKQAFQAGFIRDGHTWIDALQDRNLTAHTYDEATAIMVENKIRQSYYPILAELYQDFKERLAG